ncbi:MAG: thioredoxin family protein [Acidimicrobiia bacterium]
MAIPAWTVEDLDRAVRSGARLLVDLRADWCPQCGPQEGVVERVMPAFEGVAAGSIDVGRYPEVAERHEVVSLPTLLLFRNSRLAECLTGFNPAPLVRAALQRLVD